MSKRFSYIKFNETSTIICESAKAHVEELEQIVALLGDNRETALAMTKLEEAFMWIGKAIRNRQVQTFGESSHIPERTDG